ncbi:MAG: sigma-70 family RNA polymerase sigma factor [Rhodospirillales bacterium]|nr:sigma-70 family RNA polymerase sigma factor [Rhodospirillales bacterium]
MRFARRPDGPYPAPAMDTSGPDRLTDLIAAAASGDRRAFADLYRATGAKLFGLALRILRRRDWAEEVLQEAFVNIWRHAGAYRPERGAPFAWLATIVRNRALDRLRRERPVVPLDDAPGRESWADPGKNPLDLALASAEARRLKACLDELDGPQRESIVLAYYEGRTHEELAARFAAPLGTVKSWIRRGLIRIKGCLER